MWVRTGNAGADVSATWWRVLGVGQGASHGRGRKTELGRRSACQPRRYGKTPSRCRSTRCCPGSSKPSTSVFKSRVDKIKLLRNRAEAAGLTEIRRMADVVPLLFAHTAYKSYPEAWLIEKEMGPGSAGGSTQFSSHPR